MNDAMQSAPEPASSTARVWAMLGEVRNAINAIGPEPAPNVLIALGTEIDRAIANAPPVKARYSEAAAAPQEG